MIILKMINSGPVDKGSEIKPRTPSSFIRKPTNIKKAILKPTENKIDSNKQDLSCLSKFINKMPGTKVRKRKTETCRANGISNNSVRADTVWITNVNIKKLGRY